MKLFSNQDILLSQMKSGSVNACCIILLHTSYHQILRGLCKLSRPRRTSHQQVKPPWWSKNAGEEVLHGESGRNFMDSTQNSLFVWGESKFSFKGNIGLKVMGLRIQLDEGFSFVLHIII